jgi:hypothetical protein
MLEEYHRVSVTENRMLTTLFGYAKNYDEELHNLYSPKNFTGDQIMQQARQIF